MEELSNIHCKANASTSSKSQLIINTEQVLRISEPFTSSEHCIYRVSNHLRKMNQEAYTHVISIGPYHHGKERYRGMEKLKMECLENFRRRSKSTIEDLVNIIMKLEGSVCDCYAEDIKFGRNDFVKIILVDASFIVQFLTRLESVRLLDLCLKFTIWRDLRLLENQLPFFVIEELYNLVRASYGPNFPSFTKLSLIHFGPDNIETFSDTPNLEIKHFVDLLRTVLLPQSQRPRGERRSNDEHEHLEGVIQSAQAGNGNDQVESFPVKTLLKRRNQFHDASENLPSVTQLHRAGVKSEVSSSECLLKLEFIKRVLKIPKLRICDITEPDFRNIVAFEQRHYLYDSYVTNYTILLDSLINNAEDVDLLVEAGIIVNWVGDNNAVTTLVNNLGKNIISSNETPDYYHLSIQLKAFHSNRCHRWRAILVRDYFSTPWRAASTSAAIILLVLTFIQTIYSLFPLL